MGNDFDVDIGSRPQITNNLMPFTPCLNIMIRFQGPDLDLDNVILPTSLVRKEANDKIVIILMD